MLIKMVRKGQIWVETVIYTLIGLAIIGMLLAVVKPAIEKRRDSITIEQSVEMLNILDGKIEEVKYVAGNSRPIELSLKKGRLIIDSEKDSIEFLLDTKHIYSEPGQDVDIGDVKVLTKEKGKIYTVSLTLDYQNKLNVTWRKQDVKKEFQATSTPYNIVIKNVGRTNGLTNIDFS